MKGSFLGVYGGRVGSHVVGGDNIYWGLEQIYAISIRIGVLGFIFIFYSFFYNYLRIFLNLHKYVLVLFRVYRKNNGSRNLGSNPEFDICEYMMG